MAQNPRILSGAMPSFEDRRELTERDMLLDAPPYYSPRWLDVLRDGPLKDMLRGSYLELREDISGPRKRGVSMSQDLLARRVVYLDRILSRVELAMEYWTTRLGHDPQAEDLLMKYAVIYASNTNALTNALRLLGTVKHPARASAPIEPEPATITLGGSR